MPVKRNSTGQMLPASNPFLKMGGGVPIKNILVLVWYNFPFCKIRGSGQSGVYRLTEKAVTRLEIFTAGVVLALALEQQRPPPKRTCLQPGLQGLGEDGDLSAFSVSWGCDTAVSLLFPVWP